MAPVSGPSCRTASFSGRGENPPGSIQSPAPCDRPAWPAESATSPGHVFWPRHPARGGHCCVRSARRSACRRHPPARAADRAGERVADRIDGVRRWRGDLVFEVRTHQRLGDRIADAVFGLGDLHGIDQRDRRAGARRSAMGCTSTSAAGLRAWPGTTRGRVTSTVSGGGGGVGGLGSTEGAGRIVDGRSTGGTYMFIGTSSSNSATPLIGDRGGFGRDASEVEAARSPAVRCGNRAYEERGSVPCATSTGCRHG